MKKKTVTITQNSQNILKQNINAKYLKLSEEFLK